MAVDITDRKLAEEELRQSEERYRAVLKTMPDAVTLIDLQGIITEVSGRAGELHGFEDPGELLGMRAFDLVAPAERKRAREDLARTLQVGFSRKEYTLLRKDGSQFQGEIATSILRDAEGKPRALVCLTRDVTSYRQMERSLRDMTLKDDLTGLYNRRGFLALAEQELKKIPRTRKPVFLLYADFDRLKHVNDTLGHLAGDQALKEVAAVFRQTFRQSDILARIGGDEFAVLAIETEQSRPEILAERLQENIKSRNEERKQHHRLSLSVGLVRYDGTTPRSVEELLSRADAQMYRNKKKLTG